MKNRAEFFGYAGMVFLAAAGLVRIVLLGSGTLALGLLVVGVILFVVYFFQAEGSVQRFLGRRSTREGGSAFGTSLFVLGIVVLVNILAARFDLRVDLTADRLFTLSPETAAVLREAPVAPEVWVLYPDIAPETLEMTALLEAAQMADPRLRFHVVNPDRDPLKALEFGLLDYATVVQVGERHEFFEGAQERDFLATLIKVYDDRKLYVGFLNGHGEARALSTEPRGMRLASEALNRRGLAPFALSILTGGSLSDSLDVVVIAGPETDLTPAETDSLRRFMNRGGRLFVLLDPTSEITLSQILGPVGLRYDPRFLADPSQPDPQRIHPSEFSAHPVAHALTTGGVQVVLPGVGEVEFEETGSGIRQSPIMRSGKETTLAGDAEDAPRPRIMAGAAEWRVESGAIGRAVLIGDADFATNRYYETLANADLFLNTIQWLTERETRIELRPRDRTSRPVLVTEQQGRALMVLVVGILPLSVLAMGSVVWWRRR